MERQPVNQPKPGSLYLVPSLLHVDASLGTLPAETLNALENLQHWVVETEKNARALLKKTATRHPQSELDISVLNEHTAAADVPALLAPCLAGHPLGLLSDAGLPCIADPGALLVKAAHAKGIQVVPLTGPSSIFLALMASGLPGQNFTFHGYLPVDSAARKQALQQMERRPGHTHIFIETPYRNQRMVTDLLHTLKPATRLCIAYGLHTRQQFVITKTIADWKLQGLQLEKVPAVYLIAV